MNGERSTRRLPTWPRPSPQRRVTFDDGPAVLERLANALAAEAGHVLRGAVTVAVDQAVRCRAAELDDAARVLSSDVDGRPAWCIISDEDHRRLLECILDGPSSLPPTPVECAIAQECLERLLKDKSGVPWREAVAQLAFDDEVWRTGVRISRGPSSANMELCVRAMPLPMIRHPDVDEIPLVMRCTLRPFHTTLGNLATWSAGTRLALGVAAQEALGKLAVVGGPALFGILGESAGLRAIRLTGAAALNSGS